MVQPARERLREPGDDDRLLALEVRQLVGLAVGRLQREVRGLVADLQLRRGGLARLLL